MPQIFCRSVDSIEWSTGVPDEIYGVLVCRLSVAENLGAIKSAADLLSPDEQERAKKYHHDNDRHRFVVSRVALRMVLSRYAGTDAKVIVFETGDNGKPRIKSPAAAKLHYNLSHSGDLIVIAIGCSPVGIDIEHINPNFDFTDILISCYSQREIGLIRNAPEPRASIYQLWTRKEALLKATARGIDNDMPLIPCLDGHHTVDKRVGADSGNWEVASFMINGDYTASVVHTAAPGSIHFYEMKL